MNRIKELRDAKGWTLEQLAKEVNSSKGHVWKIEKGEVQLTPRWMARLGKAFGCDPIEILAAPKARANGPHFTPSATVRKIIDAVVKRSELALFDPAMGSGSFIAAALNAFKDVSPKRRVEAAGLLGRAIDGQQLALAKLMSHLAQNEGTEIGPYDGPVAPNWDRTVTQLIKNDPKAIEWKRFVADYWLSQANQTIAHGESESIEIDDKLVIYRKDTAGKSEPVGKVVPIVGKVAAGPWLEASPPYPIDYGDDALLTTKTHAADAFALTVEGDSMAKIYKHGARIVVVPSMRPKLGHDVVVRLTDANDPEHQVTLKRLVGLDRGRDGRIMRFDVVGMPEGDEDPAPFKLEGRRASILGTVVDQLPSLMAA